MYNGVGGPPPASHWQQNGGSPGMMHMPPRPRPGLGAPPTTGGAAPPMHGIPPPNTAPGMMAHGGHQQPDMGMYGRPPPPMGPGGMMAQHPPPSAMGPGQVAYGGPPPAAMMAAGGIPAHTTVFVGTISAGVSDDWIKHLLSACGHLRSFKRVNASFGFAEFVDAESVLRALAVLGGKELPVMSRDAQEKPEARKKLTVKADEKTRKYLDQYEQGRTKTHDHDHDESQALAAVHSIVTQMSDPANVSASENATSFAVPSHLKDLPPEDLPEEHRGAVLSEIDKFRQASAARDEERKRRERIQEMERIRSSTERGQTRGSETRPFPDGRDSHGSQSYLRPVGFVASEQAQEERNLPADERDAREEERRRHREQDDAIRASQEAERRFLAVERSRLAHWDRELSKDRADEDRRRQKAAAMRKAFEAWDQAKEVERDPFYVDRARWRAMRKPMREREEEADEADRKAQAEEEERARVEAERFLAQQAEDMAAFERQQRAAGVLMPNDGIHAPLKLKRVAGTAEEVTAQPQVPAGVLGTADDEGDISGLRKGRLAHIDLTDEETKKAQLRARLPTNRGELFATLPAWDRLDEGAVETRYKPLLDQGIVESLGESVPDMVDELLENIRKHGSAADLVEVVEPVLEEEAAPLIANLWVELLVDTLSLARS